MELWLHFGERLRRIRNRTSYTQEQVAAWEGISKQAIANREAKENPVMGLAALARLLDETHTDARYLFGQIDDDAGLADVRVSEAPATMADMITEWKRLKEDEQARRGGDSVGARVDNDELLRQIVVRLLKHRDKFQRIEGFLDALDMMEQPERGQNAG